MAAISRKVLVFQWFTRAWLFHEADSYSRTGPQAFAIAMADNVNDDGMREFFAGTPLASVPKSVFYRWADQWAAAALALEMVVDLTSHSDSGWGNNLRRNLHDFAQIVQMDGIKETAENYFADEDADLFQKATKNNVILLLGLAARDRNTVKWLKELVDR